MHPSIYEHFPTYGPIAVACLKAAAGLDIDGKGRKSGGRQALDTLGSERAAGQEIG